MENSKNTKAFFFRKVFHDGIKDFIITGKTKRLVIRNQNFLFKFKENDKLSIKDENLGLKVKIPIKKNEQIEFPIKNEQILITPQKEIEFDGIFKNKNINFASFNNEEIITIFSNVDLDNISDFKYIIIETKLSSNRIEELIFQVKRDKKIMENIIKEKILYIGFINDKKIKVNIEENVKEIDFILFGLKDSNFMRRDMTQYIDWETIKELKELKNIFIKELRSIKKYLKKKEKEQSKK